MNGFGTVLGNYFKAIYVKIALFLVGFIFVLIAYQTLWFEGSVPNGPSHHFVKTNKIQHSPSKSYKVMQIQRRSMVNKVCKQNHNRASVEDRSKFTHIIVNDKYKLLYCVVPKVACTNWKRVMMVLTGKLNVSQPYEIPAGDAHSEELEKKYLRRLNTYPLTEIKKKLQTYTKFMFVREPMERLLSAYRNKFTKSYNSYFHQRYGRKIIKNYRNNPSKTALLKGNDVEFHEFIKYLLDPMRLDVLNDHWEFFYKLCLPCVVNYDIIGKYETLLEDAKQVLHRVGVDKFVSFPENRYAGTPTSQLMKDAFRNVSQEEIHQLWRMYSVDYAMFGYSYPNFDSGR